MTTNNIVRLVSCQIILVAIFQLKLVACSDFYIVKTFGSIELRYTSFCPKYHDTKKLEKLFASLTKIQPSINFDVLILVNRIPLKSGQMPFITIAFDTLREMDRSLYNDFTSYYSNKELWNKSKFYKDKVPFLEKIHYPMNVSISKIDTSNRLGLKLIYNYAWDEQLNSKIDSIHARKISTLLNWAKVNISEIEKIQQEVHVKYEYNDWNLSVTTIPESKVKEIISGRNYKIESWIMIILVITSITLIQLKYVFKRSIH